MNRKTRKLLNLAIKDILDEAYTEGYRDGHEQGLRCGGSPAQFPATARRVKPKKEGKC
jgi:hypothetical protein